MIKNKINSFQIIIIKCNNKTILNIINNFFNFKMRDKNEESNIYSNININ